MPDQATTRARANRPVLQDDAPVARRVRPPSWRDTRLLVGIAIVLASVVAGALVVSAADETAPVYVATRTLSPGETLAGSDLKVVRARISDGQARYLSAAAQPPAGQVVLRAVPVGELVPLSALGTREQVELRPVSVPVAPEVAEPLTDGVLVDVWVAPRDLEKGASSYSAPQQVASNAQVAGRSSRRGALGSASSTAVQVLLTTELVPKLIEAVDNGARITLVPVPATTPRGDA